MRCRLVLCEGFNECCFVQPLLNRKPHWKIKSKDISRINELVRSYKDREDVWIIHDGNGKQHTYKKTRYLVTNLRWQLPAKLILILDENGNDIFNELRGNIESFVAKTDRFDGVWKATVMDDGDNILKVCFANRKECQILLLITPESLERKVAEKLETKYELSREYDDPHIFINEVAKEGRIPGVENACDIFKLACSDGWFKGERWFHLLSQVFDRSHPFLK
ncbi:MAG: hypothetical protein ACXQS5_00375 [Candidatus Methanospirareceae archaeon]